ncbi:MAG: hypothetical protein JKX80_00900 [Candidatus Pacebacteria bacterium]|nr:hypothetical protein [Candidatus Paceibacterota bacterium]
MNAWIVPILTALVAGFVTFFIGRSSFKWTSKRQADIDTFRAFESIISYDVFQALINQTYDMRFQQSLNVHINEFDRFANNPVTFYHSTKLAQQNIVLKSSLDALMSVVNSNFGKDKGSALTSEITLRGHVENNNEKYQAILLEVRTLNDKFEKEYKEFVNLAKSTLLI